jgi:hypothetical protein
MKGAWGRTATHLVPFLSQLLQKIDSMLFKSLLHNATRHNTMQTTTTTATTTTTTTSTTATISPIGEYDFENDDDSFYDLIDFGISSNRGRLCINRV